MSGGWRSGLGLRDLWRSCACVGPWAPNSQPSTGSAYAPVTHICVHTCMAMCMHTCTCIQITCVYLHTYLCICTHIYACLVCIIYFLDTYTGFICTHTRAGIRACVFTYWHACICVYGCIRCNMYVLVCTHTHILVYMCAHICIYGMCRCWQVCAYVCLLARAHARPHTHSRTRGGPHPLTPGPRPSLSSYPQPPL